jgi:hypothetical protein
MKKIAYLMPGLSLAFPAVCGGGKTAVDSAAAGVTFTVTLDNVTFSGEAPYIILNYELGHGALNKKYTNLAAASAGLLWALPLQNVRKAD